jgi:hypothetical protein
MVRLTQDCLTLKYVCKISVRGPVHSSGLQDSKCGVLPDSGHGEAQWMAGDSEVGNYVLFR